MGIIKVRKSAVPEDDRRPIIIGGLWNIWKCAYALEILTA